jgi:hypothetical protein
MILRAATVITAGLALAAFGPPVKSPAYVVPAEATDARGQACVDAPTPACLLIEIAARSYQLDPNYAAPIRQELVSHARSLLRAGHAPPEFVADIAARVGLDAERDAPVRPMLMGTAPDPRRTQIAAQLAAWGFAETLAALSTPFEQPPASRPYTAWPDLNRLLWLASPGDRPEVARTILRLAQPFHVNSDAMVEAVADWAVGACELAVFDAALAIDPARYAGWDRLVERARLTGDVADAVWDAQWAEWEGGHGLVEEMTRGFRVIASSGFCPAAPVQPPSPSNSAVER